MQELRRFARYWDLIANSGNFVETTPLIWRRASSSDSPFAGFLRWSRWLHCRVGRTDGIALVRLMALLFDFLTAELKLEPSEAARPLWRDDQRGGRRDKPLCLKDFLSDDPPADPTRSGRPKLPKRQARHLV